MRVMFIEAKRKLNDAENINFDALPKQVFLAYSIQYKKLAEKVRKKLGKRVVGFSQVLGCSQLKSKHPILLIGSGRFHALQLALQGNMVYILEDKIRKLQEKEVEKFKARRKTALSRFLFSSKIGILVSYKPGQEKLESALKLKRKLKKQGKDATLFLADNININELENYDIESWVNTACPALLLDSLKTRILNIEELKK